MHLAKTWVSIAPLRFGAGMKGKVGEAMAAGVPVVTTSFGSQGFGVEPGKHLLVGDDAQSFANEVVRLLKNPDLRRSIGSSGQSFIMERYSPGVVNEFRKSLVRSLNDISVKSIRLRSVRLAARKYSRFMDRHLLWRFKGGQPQ